MTSHLPMALQHPDAALLEKPDGFSIHLDLAHERADIVLGRPPFNVILMPQRDQLRAFLQEQGVGTEVYYPTPLHLQACYKDLGYREGDFPESERAAKESLALPIFPELTEAQQLHVTSQIAAFFASR